MAKGTTLLPVSREIVTLYLADLLGDSQLSFLSTFGRTKTLASLLTFLPMFAPQKKLMPVFDDGIDIGGEAIFVGRLFFILAGHLCLSLAIVGIFLPILPTVPFVLLAAACYSRGSEKFYLWIVNHPRFGSTVVEWRDHRVVRPRAKLASVCTIAISLCFPIFVIDLPLWGRVLVGVIGVSVIVFLISCPSEAPKTEVDEGSDSPSEMKTCQDQRDKAEPLSKH